MNKNRRKRLRDVVQELSRVKSEVQGVCDEEDYARDNMPENFQETSRYMDSEDASEAMENAVEKLGDAIDDINEAISAIEEVV